MSGECEYSNMAKTVLGSTKAMVMEETVFRNQRGWAPMYSTSNAEFLSVTLTQLDALYYLVGEDDKGKTVFEIHLNSLRKYEMKTKTWHELTQEGGNIIAFHFEASSEFESFFHLQHGLLLGMNKLKDQRQKHLDETKFLNDLIVFQMQPMRLNTLERNRSTPGLADNPAVPPVPPRKQPSPGVRARESLPGQASARSRGSLPRQAVDYDLVQQWRCIRCTLFNHARSFKCEACQIHRDDAWECRLCYRIYVLDVSVCPACGVVRCRHCTFQNDPGSRFCAACSKY